MAKTLEYFQKILDTEREKCRALPSVKTTLLDAVRSKLAGSEQERRDYITVLPAVEVLTEYARVGSNKHQRKLALIISTIFTHNLGLSCLSYPEINDMVDRCAQVYALKKIGVDLHTNPTALNFTQRTGFDQVVRDVRFKKDLDFSKLLVSALLVDSVTRHHKPTEKKSGFASALAVIVPDLGLELTEDAAYIIVHGIPSKTDPDRLKIFHRLMGWHQPKASLTASVSRFIGGKVADKAPKTDDSSKTILGAVHS